MAPNPMTAAPTIKDKVAFLSALADVEDVIETHMAFVFLTRDHALKLKKPVWIGHSDCRTLARRERAIAKGRAEPATACLHCEGAMQPRALRVYCSDECVMAAWRKSWNVRS